MSDKWRDYISADARSSHRKLTRDANAAESEAKNRKRAAGGVAAAGGLATVGVGSAAATRAQGTYKTRLKDIEARARGGEALSAKDWARNNKFSHHVLRQGKWAIPAAVGTMGVTGAVVANQRKKANKREDFAMRRHAIADKIERVGRKRKESGISPVTKSLVPVSKAKGTKRWLTKINDKFNDGPMANFFSSRTGRMGRESAARQEDLAGYARHRVTAQKQGRDTAKQIAQLREAKAAGAPAGEIKDRKRMIDSYISSSKWNKDVARAKDPVANAEARRAAGGKYANSTEMFLAPGSSKIPDPPGLGSSYGASGVAPPLPVRTKRVTGSGTRKPMPRGAKKLRKPGSEPEFVGGAPGNKSAYPYFDRSVKKSLKGSSHQLVAKGSYPAVVVGGYYGRDIFGSRHPVEFEEGYLSRYARKKLRELAQRGQ